MAEGDDSSEKQHDPSQRKLTKAIEQGQVAKSQEMTTWIMLIGATLMIAFVLPLVSRLMMDRFRLWLGEAENFHFESGKEAQLFSSSSLLWFVLILALPLTIMMITAIISNLSQHPFVMTAESLKPKFDRISPLSGFKRVFSLESLLTLGKGLVKISLVALVLVVILWPDRDFLESLIHIPLQALPDHVYHYVLTIFISSVLAFTLIALFDYSYQRHKWWEKLKMSHQEMKDEFKETEGSPEIKRKIREIRMGRARQQLAATIPMATVVITNPTHFAVALRYEEGMEAPEVVGKGLDLVAQKIRELAREHNVPIVENKPLARALYASVEVGETILPEHYSAVAKILSHFMALKHRVKSR